jgi:hypothetical protein
MDKVGPLRKLSRHLEGSENRAGIGSDLISGAYEIYVRNQAEVEKLLRAYATNVSEKRMARQNGSSGRRAGFRSGKTQATQPTPTGGVTQ